MKDFSPLAITSAVVGFPARVGVITLVSGPIIRFAESDEAITVDGDTFSVIAGLQVSAVKHTANGEMPSCEINAVHGIGYTFDSVDIDIGLFDGATVQLYIVDRLNLIRKGLLFTGAISTISLDPCTHQVKFSVKGPASSARIVMTQKRTPMCRTDLFSTLCQVDKTAYDVTANIATIPSAFTFTVSGVAQANGYFNGGVILASNGVAFVAANWVESTQTISTFLPINRLLEVGLTVTMYPGCDKTLSATGCGKFNNQLSFQGEPHFTGTAAAAQQV